MKIQNIEMEYCGSLSRQARYRISLVIDEALSTVWTMDYPDENRAESNLAACIGDILKNNPVDQEIAEKVCFIPIF